MIDVPRLLKDYPPSFRRFVLRSQALHNRTVAIGSRVDKEVVSLLRYGHRWPDDEDARKIAAFFGITKTKLREAWPLIQAWSRVVRGQLEGLAPPKRA